MDKSEENLARWNSGIPECGKDFCDTCGDCLHCYGDESCYAGGVDNGFHVWVVYDDRETPYKTYGKTYY